MGLYAEERIVQKPQGAKFLEMSEDMGAFQFN